MCLRIGDTWWLDRRERSSGPKVGSQRVKLEAVFGKWEQGRLTAQDLVGSIQRAMGAWQDAAPGGDLKWVTDQKQTSSSSVPTGDWCWALLASAGMKRQMSLRDI